MQLSRLWCVFIGLTEEAVTQQYSPASQQDGEVPSPHSRTATPMDCLTYVSTEPDQQQQDGGGTYATGTLRADGEFVIFNRFDDVSIGYTVINIYYSLRDGITKPVEGWGGR